jgi:hypothetical protein
VRFSELAFLRLAIGFFGEASAGEQRAGRIAPAA